MKFDPALPPEEYAWINREIPNSILPYSSLDGYTRTRRDGELATLVLENNRLRATFVPSLGGRLWSLLDKRDERELLYRTPFCNSAGWRSAMPGSPAELSGILVSGGIHRLLRPAFLPRG